jgi:hypothetical protein
MPRLVTSLILAAVVLSACGGSSADAGSRYLEIVNPVNCALQRLTDIERAASLGDGSFDPVALPSVQAGLAEVASLRRVAVREMLGENWPGSVSEQIEGMAEIWALAAEREQRLADAYDLGAYNMLMMQNLNDPLQDANPGLIRARLDVESAQETNRC